LVAVIVPELVPSGVDTVTTTDPVDAAAGAIARMMLDVLTYQPVGAGVDPNSTAVAPSKCAPEMVTNVPPLSGPFAGETNETLGGAVDVAPAMFGDPIATRAAATTIPAATTTVRVLMIRPPFGQFAVVRWAGGRDLTASRPRQPTQNIRWV
jgi:hypothetical protein